MKSASSAIALCGFLLGVWQTNAGTQPVLQPTPLEAFAELPATHIAWSKEVGRLDTSDAHAVVTALVLEDTAQPPDQMCGIRIDLRDRDSKDQIYLGVETLAAYRNALDEIRGSVKQSERHITPGGTYYSGARLFWYGDKIPRVHTLNAADYTAPDSYGLSLSAFKHVEFRFPRQEAAQLSMAISKAVEELRSK
jgi:hypothetical protein